MRLQALLSSDRRGQSAQDNATAALAKLGAPPDAWQASELADPFPLEAPTKPALSMNSRKSSDYRLLELCSRLRPAPGRARFSPGTVGILVFVKSMTLGRVPPFEEVEPDVKAAWLTEQRSQQWRTVYAAMRAKYEIVLPATIPADASRVAPLRPDPRWYLPKREKCADARRSPWQRNPHGDRLPAAGRNAFSARCSWAHEIPPAYLEIKETSPITLVFCGVCPPPAECVFLSNCNCPTVFATSVLRYANNSPIRTLSAGRFMLRAACQENPSAIAGLESTIADVLVRVEHLDGSTQLTRLTTSQPSFVVEASPGIFEVARTYIRLGIEHILTGIDHLLSSWRCCSSRAVAGGS